MTGITAVDTLPQVVTLPNLDLNLLIALDALLEQRGVTRAAQQLGLSQPALSASLARLRRHFGDELLARTGNEYRLTPLAAQLKPRVRLALEGVERVFTAQPEFDPAESTREFSVLLSDYACAVLGNDLAELLAQEAPRARLRLEHNTPEAVDAAAQTLLTRDLLVLPHGFITDLPHVDLVRDRWVIVVASGHPEVGDSLTLGQLAELPWVATYYGPTASTPAALQMRMLGIEPRVQVVTESFLTVPGLVAGTRRIALLQERLATRLPEGTGVRFPAVPVRGGRAHRRRVVAPGLRPRPRARVVPGPRRPGRGRGGRRRLTAGLSTRTSSGLMPGISDRRFPDGHGTPHTPDVAPVTPTGHGPAGVPVPDPTLDGPPIVAPTSVPPAVPSPRSSAAVPVADEVAVDPATGRPAGRAQALVLLLSSCLGVLGAVLLAPVLPAIQDAFAGTPGVEALAPIVLTAPALVIGITAPFAGRIVDRLGRKRLLVGALVLYAFVGTAPRWLPSLQLIVASRVLVGLTEAAIMTCCTTLLADYFAGAQRQRYFGLQVIFTTVAATVFFGLGGALGSHDWRTPFWLYVVSLPLAAAAARYIWQPAAQARGTGKLPALPWRRLRGPVGTSLVGGLVFYVLIVELSFKLDAIGVHATGTIGAVSAVSSLGTAVGAFVFGRIAGRGPRTTVPLAFALTGVGLLALGLVSSLPLVVVTSVVAGFGNGLLLPALLSWAVGPLTFEQRGRGTGFWTAAMFLGEFVCPLVVNGLHSGFGGLGTAIAVLGGVSVVTALAVRAFGARAETS